MKAAGAHAVQPVPLCSRCRCAARKHRPGAGVAFTPSTAMLTKHQHDGPFVTLARYRFTQLARLLTVCGLHTQLP